MSFRSCALTLLIALSCSLQAFGQQKEQEDSLVRLVSAQSIRVQQEDTVTWRRVFGPARFLHNGTYLLCDTAYWNVNTQVINAFGNVQLIQEETVLSSDKLDYLIDQDLAQFRGGVVQLLDKEGNLLRTRHLDYNTKDSVAVFTNGCSMKDADGQVIESIDGTYDSKIKRFQFDGNVNMYTDSMFVKSNHLDYFSDREHAYFPTGLDVWKEDNMLSADYGFYNRGVEVFLFKRKVHLMTQDQEAWTDTLFFYRDRNDVEMYGESQMTDTTRNVITMARHMYYSDTLAMLSLHKKAAVVAISEEEATETEPAHLDSLYFGGDTLVYYSLMKFQIPNGVYKASEERVSDISTDPVTEYRKKAWADAQEAKKQAAMAEQEKARGPKVVKKSQDQLEAEEHAENRVPKRQRQRRRNPDLPEGVEEPERTVARSYGPEEPVEVINESEGPATAVAEPVSTLPEPVEGTSATVPEPVEGTTPTVPEPTPTVPEPVEGPAAPADSLSAPADSLMAPLDSTKVGFIYGKGHVKLFRKDIQVACDSLAYTELDSLVRFYKNPLVWNEENRQYSADSISVIIKNNKVEKASLMSEAFIAIREESDTSCFDQIKGAEILAYFDSTSALRRLDALGSSMAMFYLAENGALATVNKVECKMFSAEFADGTIETVHYYDKPHNDAWPVVQMKDEERKLKGFSWQEERRPMSSADITTQEIRPLERNAYLARPKTDFKQTDIYFPGYMKGVYKGLEEARKPKPKKKSSDKELTTLDTSILELSDSLALRDSLAVADSLGVLRDTLALKDSVAVADSLHRADSLSRLQARRDSLRAAYVPTEKELKAREKERKRQEKEAKRAAKLAEKEAKWARLDSLDAIKREQKLEKQRAKKRKETLRQLEAIEKEQERENAIRQKWIEYYTARKQEERKKTITDRLQIINGKDS